MTRYIGYKHQLDNKASNLISLKLSLTIRFFYELFAFPAILATY